MRKTLIPKCEAVRPHTNNGRETGLANLSTFRSADRVNSDVEEGGPLSDNRGCADN